MTQVVYGSSSGLSDYVEALGFTLPVGDADAALLRGSIAIDAAYEPRFPGSRASWTQDRAWPRVDATWPDGTTVSGVPDIVVYAAYEAAFLELTTPGSLSPVVTPARVKRRSKVDTIEVEYAKDWNSADLIEGSRPVSTKIEGILWPLVGTRRSMPGILVV